jgi:hypothetical protein
MSMKVKWNQRLQKTWDQLMSSMKETKKLLRKKSRHVSHGEGKKA